MTVAWPYGLADPGIYAYLMTAAAHANMNGYPYPALQSAVSSPFSYYPPGFTSAAQRPSPYPNVSRGLVRDNLFQKSTPLIDTMNAVSSSTLLQQSKTSPTQGLLTAHQPFMPLFQPYKE